MSPQSELQEVLGAEEEAGLQEGEEPASLGDHEQKQEDAEVPVSTTVLAVPAPGTQVGSGGVLGAG